MPSLDFASRFTTASLGLIHAVVEAGLDTWSRQDQGADKL
jgi:hypothetical protein